MRVSLVHGLIRGVILGLLPLVASSPVMAEDNDEPFPHAWFWGTSEQRMEQRVLLGRAAPSLEGAQWVRQNVTAEQMEGRIVIIDFFATWCPPAIAAIGVHQQLLEEYKDHGLMVIGICGSTGQDRLPQLIEQRNIEYPVATDPDHELAEAWQVMWWPMHAVLDRQGRLRAIGVRTNHLRDVIDVLLTEQAEDGEPLEVDLGEGFGQSGQPQPPMAEQDEQRPPAGPRIQNPGQVQAEWLEGDEARREALARLEATRPLPQLEVANWKNTEPLDIQELAGQGKVILLTFWATWSGGSLQALANLNELHERYAERGLVIIGICNHRGGENVDQIAAQYDIRFPIAVDVEGQTIQRYMIDGFPDHYLIDRAGVLRMADVRHAMLVDAVEMLLAEELVEP